MCFWPDALLPSIPPLVCTRLWCERYFDTAQAAEQERTSDVGDSGTAETRLRSAEETQLAPAVLFCERGDG